MSHNNTFPSHDAQNASQSNELDVVSTETVFYKRGSHYKQT